MIGIPPLTQEERAANITRSLEIIRRRAIDQLRPSRNRGPMIRRTMPVHVVCYGPSLLDTWEEIRGPVITVSGAHDFLLARSVMPTWHVESDPRAHKAAMLSPWIGVNYIIATQCDGALWAKLAGHPVRYFIAGGEAEELRRLHPMPWLEITASTAGLAAIIVAELLGFRRAIVHGMDCSYIGRARHAGPHAGGQDARVYHELGSEVFTSSPAMIAAAHEFGRLRPRLSIKVELRGRGMLQAMQSAPPAPAVKRGKSRAARAVAKAFAR